MAVNAEAHGDGLPNERPDPITTLRGWRRFVEAVPPHFELLPEAEWAALSEAVRPAYNKARFDYHCGRVVLATPTIQEIEEQVGLSQLNHHDSIARRGLVVSGPPFTGKSTGLTQLGRAYELWVRQRYPSQDRIPVVYVSTPPQWSPRNLAAEVARFLGLSPINPRASFTNFVDAVGQALTEARCDLVLVDEIHNLYLPTAAGEYPSDQLKYLTERLPATFVYAGINLEQSGLFTGVRGTQTAGRFVFVNTGPIPYGPEWEGLVATLEAGLRLHCHEGGTLTGLDRYLHERTHGMIGNLSHLILAGALAAIDDGSEAITRQLLETIPLN
ncbi:ATP-binding protein [Micromonospora inositola]|uniref:TniB protein n=1 Tax=Micromonospora inositola TaxID=47865 RepID=A0A1C5JNX2_9ACTN|nr:ATP-binding protein [Micromonospora inositola]SCG72217.1 TniB protein [Micromonospora inositola]